MATFTFLFVLGLALCSVYGQQRFSRRSGSQSSDVIVDVDVRTSQDSSSRDSSRGFDRGFDRFDRGGAFFDGVGGFDRGFGRGRGFIDPIVGGVGGRVGGGVIGVGGIGGGVGIGVLPVGGVGFGGGRSFFGGRRRRGRPVCRGIRRGRGFGLGFGDCALQNLRRRPRRCLSDVDCPVRRVCCFDGCSRRCYRPFF